VLNIAPAVKSVWSKQGELSQVLMYSHIWVVWIIWPGFIRCSHVFAGNVTLCGLIWYLF